MKCSLGGARGLAIFAAGYPRSERIACDSAALVAGVEQIVTAGASTLTYDPTTDQYTYVWKTDTAWAKPCRLDHAAAGESVGLRMPKSTVLVFGNPRLGTPNFITHPTLGD